ncbi:MAG: hypothetical protein HOH19_02840, partial [Kordiimonadaceae bacterium]|nr:hypothetical protein [Kordiimonadaceae bacterium]
PPALAQDNSAQIDQNVKIDENESSVFNQDSIEDDYFSVPLFEDGEITFTTGYDYSSGKFNLPSSTNISYVPYSLKYSKGPWSVRASSGYISFASPRNVITAVEGAPLVTDVNLTPSELNNNNRRSGFGDVYLTGSYAIENPFSNDLFVDFSASVKIPTADESRGLGTGKVDYTVKADASYLIGSFMPFATIGYRFVGKTHLYDLQNSFFASVGLSYYITYDTSIGVSYDYRESATPGFNSPKEIFGYLDIQLDDNWGFNIYSVVGMNNVTTDYGLGTQIRYKF